MTKVFIYNEVDLIEELQNLIDDTSGSWEEEGKRYRHKIKEIIILLKKCTEVMVK